MGCDNSTPAKKQNKRNEDPFPAAAPRSSTSNPRQEALNFWKEHVGSDVDAIDAPDFEKLFGPLQVDASKSDAFVFVFMLDCKQVWAISRDEFVEGNVAQKGALTNASGVANAIKDTKHNMHQDLEIWRKFNTFTFNFSRNSTSATIISTEEAIPTMTLIVDMIPEAQYPHPILFDWYKANVKAMSRDLWKQSFKFIREIKADLSNYSEMQCWHTEIDEFVEQIRGGGN